MFLYRLLTTIIERDFEEVGVLWCHGVCPSPLGSGRSLDRILVVCYGVFGGLLL